MIIRCNNCYTTIVSTNCDITIVITNCDITIVIIIISLLYITKIYVNLIKKIKSYRNSAAHRVKHHDRESSQNSHSKALRKRPVLHCIQGEHGAVGPVPCVTSGVVEPETRGRDRAGVRHRVCIL